MSKRLDRNKALRFDWDYINSVDDTDEKPVCLTWAERQILLSMVDYIGWETRWDTGSGFNTDQIQQWQASIVKRLIGGCMSTGNCDYVWACLGIDTEPGSLEAWLIGQLGENGDVIDAVANPSPAVSPVATSVMVSECDKDNVFAFSLQLVRFINLAIEDVFQLIEAATNSIDFAKIVLQKIPGASTVANFADYLFETMAEQYLASYTTTLENNYACEIMCMIVSSENCTATWEDLYQYFLQRFGAGLENKNLIDLLEFIGGGGWSGTEFVDAGFAAFCGMMYYGERWSDITLAGVQRFWDSWLNDENTDWSSLCGSDCGWTLIQPITSTEQETWWEDTCGVLSSIGLEVDSCGGYEGLIVNVTLPETRTVNRIEIDYRSNNVGNAHIGRWTVFDDDEQILQQGQWDLVVYTGEDYNTFIKYIDQTEVHRVKFELIANWTVDGDGYVKTNEVTLSGQGEDPFE